MNFPRPTALLLLAASSIFAMDFADFDTTVQVRTFTRSATDSTFIPLRNTGFTLSYTVKATTNCPTLVALGDFEVRPDSRWLVHLTQDMGDSAFHKQSRVVGYCDTALYVRQFLPPMSKYQLHMVMGQDLKMDTLYTMVAAQLDDSTFTLRVSARPFGTASVLRRAAAASGTGRGAFSPDGRRVGPRTRIRVGSSGTKEIDLAPR